MPSTVTGRATAKMSKTQNLLDMGEGGQEDRQKTKPNQKQQPKNQTQK